MNVENQIKKINDLIQKGNIPSYKLALERIENLQKKIPINSFVQNLTGIINQRLGRISSAISYYQKAHELDNKNISPLNNLAYVYETLKKWKEAKIYFDKISKLDANNLIYLINISNYYFSINQILKSNQSLEKAMKIEPNNRNVLYNLARNYANEGRFKESIELIKKVISLDKNFFPAHIQLVNLKKEVDKEHVNFLFELLNNREIEEDKKADLYFALANSQEKLKNDEEFFKYLNKANKLYKKNNEFKKEKVVKLFSSLTNSFKNFDFKKKFESSNEEKKIIFVCGLPRSGTTLIEQILSSHSKVSGQGELEYLPWGLIDTYIKEEKFDKQTFDNDILKNNNSLAKAYFNRLKFHEVDKNIIVDKNPVNFQYMGFINTCFPSAKIILTQRNPKDVCFSIFRNNFTSSNMNWTFSESDIVDYYELYKKITNFWKEKIKKDIYEINYENLISDNENEVRKLLQFCGLKFEKECLDHSKNSKSKIASASVLQARQPIYKTSINNSKKYDKYLSELFLNIK